MIKSGAKVSIEQTDEGTIITINPEIAPWQQFALGAWVVIWLICGMFIGLSLLKGVTSDEQIFYLVFLGFWGYFLFYAVRSLIWNKIGREYVRIGAENLAYKRAFGEYGKVSTYDLETVKHLGKLNYEDKTWAKVYHDAFWTVGGEQIGFEYFGKKIAFGFKLNEKQVNEILKRIPHKKGKKK